MEDIWNTLANRQAKQPNSSGREAVPLLKSILIALWVVGTSESYRSVADRFDVTKSTVFVVLDNVRNQLIQVRYNL